MQLLSGRFHSVGTRGGLARLELVCGGEQEFDARTARTKVEGTRSHVGAGGVEALREVWRRERGPVAEKDVPLAWMSQLMPCPPCWNEDCCSGAAATGCSWERPPKSMFEMPEPMTEPMATPPAVCIMPAIMPGPCCCWPAVAGTDAGAALAGTGAERWGAGRDAGRPPEDREERAIS